MCTTFSSHINEVIKERTDHFCFTFCRNYVEELWLSLFSNEELVLFSYQSYAMGKGIHELQPTTTGGGRVLAADEEFVCCFPFFWLIKEAIEAKLDAVRTSSSKYK